MKLKQLNGKVVNVDVSKFIGNKYSVSKIQRGYGDRLRKRYPHYLILEEFPIPGSKLRIDFFLPELLLAVEVHGEQHFKFTPFFHKSIHDFMNGVKRDAQKAEWCNLNDIELIIVRQDDNLEGKIDEFFRSLG